MGRPDDTPPAEPGKPVDAPGKPSEPEDPPIEIEGGGNGPPPCPECDDD